MIANNIYLFYAYDCKKSSGLLFYLATKYVINFRKTDHQATSASNY